MAQSLEPRIKRLYAMNVQDIILGDVDADTLNDDIYAELTASQRHDITRDMVTYNSDAKYLRECRAQLALLNRKPENARTDMNRARLNREIANTTASQTRIEQRYAIDELREELIREQTANEALVSDLAEVEPDLNEMFGVKRRQSSYTAHRDVLRQYEGKELSELDYDRMGAEIEELREQENGLHM